MENMMKKWVLGILCLVVCSVAGVYAVDVQTKQKLADEYFEVIDFKQSMQDAMKEANRNKSAKEQKVQADILTYVRFDFLEDTAKKALVKHMTTKELETFVAFVKTKEGRSALDKMKFYVADTNQVFAQEWRRASMKYAEKNK